MQNAKNFLCIIEQGEGACIQTDAGWVVAAHFGDPDAEYQATRRHAAVFNRSHQGKIHITGPDAPSFLHNLCTNNILDLPLGAGCETYLTTGQAKIIAHGFIHCVPSHDGTKEFLLDTGPGYPTPIIAHLERHLISEQVEVSDQTNEWAQLHVAGPQAAAILGKALDKDVAQLKELQHVTLGSYLEIVCHHSPLGVPGYDVFAYGDALSYYRAILEAGAQRAGLIAYETLRIEAGTPRYGVDIDETNLPQEVGRIEQAVSFTKGCYLGQETILRIRTYGHPNRSLIGLRFESGDAVPTGSKVFRDGKEVGHVTSSIVSPRLDAAIALAYVRRGNQEPGTALEVTSDGGARRAVVTGLPFVGS